MSSVGNLTETLLIRLFRGALVFLMSMALLIALGFGIYAGFQLLQEPKSVKIEKVEKRPPEPIKLDGFVGKLKEIIKESERSSEDAVIKAVAEPPIPALATKLLLEEATAVYRCSLKFGSALGHNSLQMTSEEEAMQIEVLRRRLLEKSSHQEWARDMASFVCSSLENTALVELKKKNPKISILFPLIEFHLLRWHETRRMETEAIATQAKAIRDAESREEDRVRKAHLKGSAALMPTGIGLSVFFALAIYLIILRIEGHLREISVSLKSDKE